MAGNFESELVVMGSESLLRVDSNRWPPSSGTGGRLRLEYLAEISGIRT